MDRKKSAVLFGFANLLGVVRIAVLIAIPGYIILTQFESLLNGGMTTSQYILDGITIVIWGFLYIFGGKYEKYLRQTRNDFEFDENGISYQYNELQALSKKERQEIAKQRIADLERVLGTGTIRKITKKGSEYPEEDLEKLMGLPKVKQQILEMNARMEYDAQKKKRDKKNGKKNIGNVSAMHMCFFGPPGTGKTTCAKIMTGFLYRNGFIKKNQFLETDGNFLRGQTAGETTEKTRMLLNYSKGKVLFIDEAYALLSSHDSQEAMATLIKSMEDDKDNLVVILAGYEAEMKQLIDANPGFFSRITHYLYFGDYSTDVLCDIFSSMANEHNLYVPYETRDRLSTRIDNEKKLKYFGNARTVRNILDESISHHALNMKKGLISEEKRYHICPEDIDTRPSSKVNKW